MDEPRRIVVIHPPQEVVGDYIDYPYYTNLPASSLVAALRARGHLAHLLDAFAREGACYRVLRRGKGMFGVAYTELLEPLANAEFDWAVIHFTPYALATGERQGLAWLITRLREMRPDAGLIGAELYAGGMHRTKPSIGQVRAWYPELDGFVSLEGEETIPRLCESESLDSYHVVGKAASEGMLNSLGVPVWNDEALEHLRSFYTDVGHLPKIRQYRVDARTLPLHFSRGCPFNCSFCSNPYQDYRPLSLDAAKALVEWAQERGFDRFFVLDDAANVRADFEELLEFLGSRRLSIELPNGLRADLLSEERVRLLSLVTDKLTISAESAVPRLQKEVVGKNISVAHLEQVAKWCNSYDLDLYVHWMVGLPGEVRSETVVTLDTARRLLDETGARPLIQYATPLPGTRLGGKEAELLLDAGHRMQHEATHVPEGVDRHELAQAVSLLRQRGRDAGTAKVIVNITYQCNNHCVFCAVGNRVKQDLSLDYIKEVLARYREQGVGLCDLDGGEPTLHPDLIEIVSHARKLGYRTINITSNGRRLAYKDFARRLLASGITSLLISIHGPDAATHDEITGVPGSFQETMQGIQKCLALAPEGLDFGVNTTLSIHNFRRLEELVNLLFSIGVRKFNVQFLTPFGRAAQSLVPEPGEAAAVVREVIDKWKERAAFQVINLPYCYLPGLEEYVAQDLGKLSRNMVFVTGEEVNLYQYLAATRAYDGTCEQCLFRVACDGKYDFSEVLD